MEQENSLRRHGYGRPCLKGQGTFSTVYRVTAYGTGKHYACKISSHGKMLAGEAQILAEAKHPLIPRPYEYWQEEGTGYLVMEYVPGANLEELLRRRGGFSERQTLRIAMELAEGLMHLHERPLPVLYRDLKPAHVQIREDGRVKLLDFGCACYMGKENGACVGTHGFAAPEQLAGKGSGFSGDVYAFGKVLQRLSAVEGRKDAFVCGREIARLAEKCIRENREERIPDMRLCLRTLADCRKKLEERKIPLFFGRPNRENFQYVKDLWKKSPGY